jgi:methionyl-tRNA synthetase
MFLADRYIVGTCHEWGYEEARGDECPRCGKWLDPLRMPKVACKVCGTVPVRRSTSHWYLDLPKLRDDGFREWFEAHPWKPNVRAFIGNQIAELRPRPITRDMRWGVPVPEDRAGGETGKVLYVWFDAPIGYVSFTQQWARERGRPEDWERWWKDGATRLVHFIGKDNIPFHCLVFPSMLFGQRDGWVLPAEVPANEFYNLEGGKFSTSKDWTIPLGPLVERHDAEVVRFHLLASAPETADSEWRWEDFQRTANAGLADTIGNLATRVLRFAAKHFDARVPALAPGLEAELDRALLEECGPIADPARSVLEFRFRRATEELLANGAAANVFIDRHAPWALRTKDPERTAAVLNTACNWIALLARWGGQVGDAQAHHLLVRVDIGARARRIDTRQHTGVGERHDGDGPAADQHRNDVGGGDPRDGERRQTLWQGAEDRHAGACCKVQRTDDDGRAHHGDQDARQALVAFEQQDHRQGDCADHERGRVGLAIHHRCGDSPQVGQRSVAFDRKAEELGQLADQYRQGDAIHVPVADGLGKQLGDEAEARDARDDADHSRYHRLRAGEGDRAQRVAARQWHDHRQDDSGQRGVRSQHQDSARPKKGVSEQRTDGRVQAIDAGKARCHRIGDANRHQHRGQHQSGHDVMPQPGPSVLAQRAQPRQPATQDGLIGSLRAARNPAWFRQGERQIRRSIHWGSVRMTSVGAVKVLAAWGISSVVG